MDTPSSQPVMRDEVQQLDFRVNLLEARIERLERRARQIHQLLSGTSTVLRGRNAAGPSSSRAAATTAASAKQEMKGGGGGGGEEEEGGAKVKKDPAPGSGNRKIADEQKETQESPAPPKNETANASTQTDEDAATATAPSATSPALERREIDAGVAEPAPAARTDTGGTDGARLGVPWTPGLRVMYTRRPNLGQGSGDRR